MMDITGIVICWACLSAMKETLEPFKLRDYQRDQQKGQYPEGALQLDLQKAFKQEKQGNIVRWNTSTSFSVFMC